MSNAHCYTFIAAKCTFTACTRIKRVCSSQVLQSVKAKFWQFVDVEHSGVLIQCQEGKTSAKITEEKVVADHQSGKGYKAISRQSEVHLSTGRAIIHKWKTFETAESSQNLISKQSDPKVRPCNAHRNGKNRGSEALQPSVSM